MIFRVGNRVSRLQTQNIKLGLGFSKMKGREHLEPSDMLESRHIGPNHQETIEMLKTCNAKSVEELLLQAIPPQILDKDSLADGAIGQPIAESQFLFQLKETLSKNEMYKCYLGGGFHPSILPGVIQRNLFENPGWYTAYTPYQAEIAQGRLQSLINYQTMVQELTKMDFSNASLLDEASAGGEGFYMTYNVHLENRKKFFMDRNVFLPTQAVIQTKAKFLGIQIIVGDYKDFLNPEYKKQEFCGVLVQTPDNKGVIRDFTSFFKQLDETKADVIKMVASDLLALTITKSPGEMGTDICFGSSQRLGVPMGFGGPYSGFFATQNRFVRKMPGRIIGLSKDCHGDSAYRMALQTRQQHIRREKATSNICTAQALLANISAMYAIYHGPEGLRNISERVNNYAQIGARIFQSYGFNLLGGNNTQYSQYFDTITIMNCDANKLCEAFRKEKINIRLLSDSEVSLSFNQRSVVDDLKEINTIVAKFVGKTPKNFEQFELKRKEFRPEIKRPQNFMKQKIFNSIHSEHQMLRYLNHLQEKDISLNRSMIPLGSCTMKLNSSSEMIPMSWPQLNLHPFVPMEQAQGYVEMIERLRSWLKSVTKFDEISFQPNSGATGEYAGLLTISQYLKSIGQSNRKLCLIPKSAHGTNPASAYLAGMQVIPVEVEDGKVDMKDFKLKAEKYKSNLGAFMITFPSTAGKYESTVHEMNEIIHFYGGQVYMDGANMNAQVGYTSPGFLGADVCHLNLHKTFAIPHGGGGPGMGPIGVKKHLTPFLPTHPFSRTYNQSSCGTIAVSEFGSASILTISYAYIAMLGKQGVKKSTTYAILNANYLMSRLRPYYKILNIGPQERCSHEFILDISEIKSKTGVSEEDISKRLMDFGLHAPTMSFPVAGTLMIEPTESEDKGQLDRFADALIKIHEEIHNCPEIVKNSPYTAASLLKSEWKHKFTREEAAYPLKWIQKRGKYWPTVGRISNPYGDKNLICACPDISAYVE